MKQYTFTLALIFDAENPYGNTEQLLLDKVRHINELLINENAQLDLSDYNLINVRDIA